MHPAYSVIFFTTASGAGYGLFIILGLGLVSGILPDEKSPGMATVILALVLIIGGLLASTFHLGHPERAWRSFSQWRSSWLSREGWLAMLSFLPILIFSKTWLYDHSTSVVFYLSIYMMILFCLLTLLTTSMIYASLKTIPAWHNPWVPMGYLLLALMTACIVLNSLLIYYRINHVLMVYASMLTIILSFCVKIGYWRYIRSDLSETNTASAIGLGKNGKVNPVQSPHSQKNYIQKEMGYFIARKHADRLRRIAIMTAFLLPLLCVLVTLLDIRSIKLIGASLAVLSMVPGILIERWLFFAEASHVVGHYYGK